jgi:hypothetical protein
MIPRRVDIHARDHLAAADKLLNHLLLLKIEHLDVLLRGHEEKRAAWMKGDALYSARGLGKRKLIFPFRYL